MRRQGVPRTAVLFATLAVLALLAAAGVYVASRPTPAVDLGIFEPVAGRIVYGSEKGIYGVEDGIWGVDPIDPDAAATPAQLTSEPGTPLGWSADGTRLLVQRGLDKLLVLHADGSETLVAEQPWGLRGAAISPDGSRVAFAGQTQEAGEHGGLFAVDAAGGRAELLWENRAATHLVRFPTFSPDGTQIAFVDDNIDTRHSVWVINADGRDAHQIWKAEGIGPGWVRGLAWSPAGDRFALVFDGLQSGIYTFAPDGSDFTRSIIPGDSGSPEPYWSPDGSQIAYTTACSFWDADDLRHGCVLRIANADDGSTVQRFGSGIAGPWHPGVPSPSVD